MRRAFQHIELTCVSSYLAPTPAATGITFGCLLCSPACAGSTGRRGVPDGRFDAAALLPRARRPKGRRALVRARGDELRLDGWNDRSRVALGPRSTAGRLRGWVVPLPLTGPDNGAPLRAIGAAELSDS